MARAVRQSAGVVELVDGDGDLLSAGREFPYPSAWIAVSAYREYELSALTTQEWARAFYAGGFDGIWCSSRHDPSGESRFVAVFGHAPLDELRLAWSAPAPIGPRLLDEVAARFGIAVLPTP